MANDFDAIIIGGGHNGLVASGYMAKAGMKTLVLERRDQVGGACITEELIPGFKFSSCSYVSWLLQPKVVKDLELYKHGLEIFGLDPRSAHPFPDGTGMLFWDEDERNKEEIAKLSPPDAEAYNAWNAFWDKAAEIMGPYMLEPAPTWQEVDERVRGTEHEEILNTLRTVSMGELLDRHFMSEKVKSCMVYSPDPRGLYVVGNALPIGLLRLQPVRGPRRHRPPERGDGWPDPGHGKLGAIKGGVHKDPFQGEKGDNQGRQGGRGGVGGRAAD